MKLIVAAFNRHVGYVRRYPFTTLLLLLSCGLLFYSATINHWRRHMVVYIVTSWFCCFITDIVLLADPKPVAVGFPVKHPVRKELLTIIGCTLLGIVFLMFRGFGDWQHMPGIEKLLLLPLILFVFPVVLACIYLFVFKYKPRELGVNLRYWYLPLILHLIWGAVTLSVVPQVSHWKQAYIEYGILGSLFTGIISAAIPEEFFRMLMQTRVGKTVNSPAFGVYIAGLIWGAMHIPVHHAQSHGPLTLYSGLEESVYLVPLGMFWGYLTMRTKSMFAAVGMHAFNLWGLQNFRRKQPCINSVVCYCIRHMFRPETHANYTCG